MLKFFFFTFSRIEQPKLSKFRQASVQLKKWLHTNLTILVNSLQDFKKFLLEYLKYVTTLTKNTFSGGHVVERQRPEFGESFNPAYGLVLVTPGFSGSA